MSNITIDFSPPILTSIIQILDHGILASFKSSIYEELAFGMGSLLALIFYYSPRFEENSVYRKACYYVELSSVEIRVPILPWLVNMRSQEWKKQQVNGQNLISSLNLGSEEMPIEE